jgi:hypothetical protein
MDIYRLPIGFKIVSGGQSGADNAGLDYAIMHDMPHGGWCPRGRMTEDGRIDDEYELQETGGTHLLHIELNVRDSDATLIFTNKNMLDGPSKRIAVFCNLRSKPYKHVHPGITKNEIVNFLKLHNVKTLNVTGQRECYAPGLSQFVLETLEQVFEGIVTSYGTQRRY